MAIFSFRMQVIGRSSGRSATAAAAYRSGEKLQDERTGQTFDYTGKSDIHGNEIIKPDNAPEQFGERNQLWNAVEKGEKRKDAQLSRELMIALPAELSHKQKEELTRDYVKERFVDKGMIADIGYHDFDSHNPHAHIMLTMRSVNEEGFGKKERQWNKRAEIESHRQAWSEYANRALEKADHAERIDHRSLKNQGVEREPQIHLGAKVLEMEAKGIQTRVGDESRRISKVNRDIARKQQSRDKVQTQIGDEQRQEQANLQTEPSQEQSVSTEQVRTHQPQEEAQKQDIQIEQQRQRNQAQQRQKARAREKKQDRGYGY